MEAEFVIDAYPLGIIISGLNSDLVHASMFYQKITRTAIFSILKQVRIMLIYFFHLNDIS